jgi:hypothetical protein
LTCFNRQFSSSASPSFSSEPPQVQDIEPVPVLEDELGPSISFSVSPALSCPLVPPVFGDQSNFTSNNTKKKKLTQYLPMILCKNY